MQSTEIIAVLDQEIARLQQARTLLGGSEPTRRRGRPKGSTSTTPATTASNGKKKNTMTAEGRASIARAQKARWAAHKKLKSGTPSAKKTAKA